MSTEARLIAIGDVHGCVHALEAIVAAVDPPPADQLVFLGDLIDQGRESCEVLDLLLALQQRTQVVLIEGNHEEMILAARDSEKALRYWEVCGGIATLNSYRWGARLDAIPPEHWELFGRCLPYFETDDFIFAHANYLADLPMAEQPDYQLRWALFEPHEARPHHSGKPVVVGHTEQPGSELHDLGFATCIDTACWRGGWLTALDVRSRQVWQASRFGMLREQGDMHHRGQLPQPAAAS
jgi:serine/threonine protein phosphatase 1